MIGSDEKKGEIRDGRGRVQGQGVCSPLFIGVLCVWVIHPTTKGTDRSQAMSRVHHQEALDQGSCMMHDKGCARSMTVMLAGGGLVRVGQ